MSRFTTRPPHLMPSADVLSPDELVRRCAAAVRLNFQGERWSADVRADVRDRLVAAVIGDMRAEHRGRPSDVLAWIDYVERSPLMARRYADAIPARAATMTRLSGMAANVRRSLERETARETADAAERHRSGAFHAGMPGAAPPSVGTLDAAAAHETARDILDALGMPRLGKLYPVAYAAARETAGNTPDETAAELGMPRGTLVSHISRAARKLPSAEVFTAAAHAEALKVDEHWTPSGKGHAAPLPSDERHRPGDRTPNTPTTVPAYPVAERKTRATRRPWNGVKAADWTRYLTPTSAARLEHAARISRDRRAARAEHA